MRHQTKGLYNLLQNTAVKWKRKPLEILKATLLRVI